MEHPTYKIHVMLKKPVFFSADAAAAAVRHNRSTLTGPAIAADA